VKKKKEGGPVKLEAKQPRERAPKRAPKAVKWRERQQNSGGYRSGRSKGLLLNVHKLGRTGEFNRNHVRRPSSNPRNAKKCRGRGVFCAAR